jgi:Rps23 Pro-64 3,4-dihydroxylase Tpa1-like proline 4-hydroxylase
MLVGLEPSTARMRYRCARPWPHLVVDDAVSGEVAAAVAAEAARVPSEAMHHQHSRRQQKLSSTSPDDLGPTTSAVLRELSGPVLIDFVEALTGLTGLVGDPQFCRAGLFVTPPGGWQRVHEDFRIHPVTRRWNRVIMLLYCSEWSPRYGGELELWPQDMSEVGTRIAPRPGRLVVFETTRSHRHGIRAMAADATPRVALASRLYSAEPPREAPSPPLLTWSPRPTERRRDVLPTVSEMLRELRARARRVRSGYGRGSG